MMKHTILIFALASATISHATVLTFDITGATSGSILPQGYGDNVTSTTMGSFSYGMGTGFTPDVTVDYVGSPGNQADLNFWATGYNDLVNVVEYEPDGAPEFSLVFTATNGQAVRLESFDLGNFGGAITLPSLTITNENNVVLWQMTNIAMPGSNLPHISFNPNVAGTMLTLKADISGLGGASDNVGLDNIAFGQEAVPEPFTMAGIAGLGLLAARRKRS